MAKLPVLVLMAGIYSDRGLVAVVQMPNNDTLRDAQRRFLDTYFKTADPEMIGYEECEAALTRMRDEGFEMYNSPEGYRPDRTWYDDDFEYLFYSWLLAQPGWTRIDYREVSIDRIIPE